MLLQLVLNAIIKEKPEFLTEYFDDVSVLEVHRRYTEMMDRLYQTKIELYSDSYPAYIYQSKCKELKQKIIRD